MVILKENQQGIDFKKVSNNEKYQYSTNKINFSSMKKNEIKQVKIIDFGSGTFIKHKEFIEGNCGTPNYVAPEILNGQQYNEKIDNFSLGCIMYFMIRGYLPFDSQDVEEIYQNTVEGTYDIDDEHWQKTSEQCKDLIQKLLCKNFQERISIEEALQHPWVKHRDELKKYIGINQKDIQ